MTRQVNYEEIDGGVSVSFELDLDTNRAKVTERVGFRTQVTEVDIEELAVLFPFVHHIFE